MKLSPKAEKITPENPDELISNQDFLLLEMAKTLEQKDDIIEKKSEVIAQLKKTHRPFTRSRKPCQSAAVWQVF